MMDDDEFDDTLRIEGVLTGEEWLTSNFMLASNEALNQTEVIKKRYQEEQKERLNKSDISRSNRPVSPFGSCGDNPFGVSKMGYANPSSDRSMLSAMKTRDKIPRTPVEKGNRKDWKDNYISDHPYDMRDYMRKPHGKEGPTTHSLLRSTMVDLSLTNRKERHSTSRSSTWIKPSSLSSSTTRS
jgi:hypothetical protein